MANENNTAKKKLGVLDVILIVALCLCIAAAGFAFVFKIKTASNVTTEDQFEEYVLSFESYGIRLATAQLLKEGDVFYYEKAELGTLNGKITTVPAIQYITGEDGKIYQTYAPDNGDFSKMDMTGTLIVKGIRDEHGIFLLNGKTQLAPNKSFTIYTSTVSVPVNITAIEKVAK